MDPVIREHLSADGNQQVPKIASLTTGSGTQAGDYILAWVSTDSNTYANIPAPVCTGHTFDIRWGGGTTLSNDIHAKAFTTTVASNGAKTITATMPSGADGTLNVAVIDGDTVASGPATWVYTANTTGKRTAATAQTAVAITAGGANENRVLAYFTTNANSTYSLPGGSPLTIGSSAKSRTWVASTVAVAPSVTGAVTTGIKTLTSSTNTAYHSMQVAIPGAATVANPKLSTLQTNFSGMPAFFSENYGTATIVDGEGHAATTNSYSGFETAKEYSFEDDAVFAEVVQAAGTSLSWQTTFMVKASAANTSVEILHEGNNLIGRVTTASGVYTDEALATYNATTHRWWRIREASGTVYFDTSPDAVTWTQRGSKANALDFSVASVALGSGHWNAADADGPDAIFDNLNVQPPAYTDRTFQSFTSGALTGGYHIYANGIDTGQPIGLMVQFHGDGGYEYDNPTDPYSLGGTLGLIEVCRARNIILIVARTPDSDDTWWTDGANNADYVRALIEEVGYAYPIDTSKVWLNGYSGGAQLITEYLLPMHPDLFTGGGAQIFGGGGDPLVTPETFSTELKSNFRMLFYTGEQDIPVNSPGEGYDGLGEAQDGAAWYTTEGFPVTTEYPDNTDHLDIEFRFGPVTAWHIDQVDALTNVVEYDFATTTQLTSGTWTRVTNKGFSGTTSLKTPAVANNASALATFAVPEGAKYVRFYYDASTEAEFDFFTIVLGSNEYRVASGVSNYGFEQSAPYDVDGLTSVTFKYVKDAASTGGSDAVWIDNVSFDYDGAAPPEEGEGTGSVISRSTTSASGTSDREGVGEGLTSRSSVSSSSTSVKAAEGHAESRSRVSGSGYGIHSGSGQTVSQSLLEGDGRELYGGYIRSYSGTSGTGSGNHTGDSDGVTSHSSGEADYAGIHFGEGQGLLSRSRVSEGNHTTVRYGVGTVKSRTSTSANGISQQLGSAGIVRPIIGMAIRLIDEDGNAGEFLPHWTDIAFTDKYNGTGTVTFTYAKEGVNAHLLNGRRVEGALFDGTFEIPGTRFLVTQSATDAVKEDNTGKTITVNAPLWVPTRLAEATIYPVNGVYTPPESGEGEPQPNYKTRFGAVSPGNIIGILLAKARDRGGALDIEQNFDSNFDSAGNPWETDITMEVDPGGSILSVLEKLTELGVCDWKSDGRELVLLNADSGTDWTEAASPINLQAGRDLLDAPEKRDAKRVTTAILVVGKDGLTVEVNDPAEEAIQGVRIESYLSVNGVDDRNTLLMIGQKALAAAKLSTESLTHELSLFTDGPIPWVNYTVGDWVYRNVADGEPPQRLRVAQLSCTYAPDGTVKGAVTLGTLYESTAQRLQAQIDALTNGSSGIATGPSTSPAEDTIPPKAPEGLIVTSDAYMVPGGGTLAAMQADWLPVVENIDGSPVKDFEEYEVIYQVIGTDWWTIAGSPREPNLVWAPMPTLTTVDVKVRAGDRFGNWSEYSDTVRLITAEDDTNPLVPSTPTIEPYLGTLRVDWDGYAAGGTAVPMDADLQGVNVEYTSDLDGDWILVDRISPGGGRAVIAGGLNYGQTYFVRLEAIDWSGNLSGPSATATGTPEQIVTIDIGPNAITRSQILDAEIVNAKIANLAVNDAKIANLSVGKLTAGVMTADVTISGSFNTSADVNNRVRMDSTGLRMTNGGVDKVLIKPDGTAIITGEIRTANSGMRLVWNSGGNRASIQFHSNATTDTIAPSLYVAANTSNAARPAVILDGPTYGRTFAGIPIVTGIVFGDDYGMFGVRTRDANNDDTFEGFYISNAGDVKIRCPGDTGNLQIRNYLDSEPNDLFLYNMEANDIWAFNYFPRSSETLKEDFAPMPASGLSVIRDAPVYSYRFKDRGFAKNEGKREHPRTVGPIVEDLPEWMRHTQRLSETGPPEDAGLEGTEAYSMNDMIGVLMSAIRELDEELDEYRAKDKKPKRKSDRDRGKRIGRL